MLVVPSCARQLVLYVHDMQDGCSSHSILVYTHDLQDERPVICEMGNFNNMFRVARFACVSCFQKVCSCNTKFVHLPDVQICLQSHW